MNWFPFGFRQALVPPLPALVRLDTAFGGQLQVPAKWLEAGGYRVRYARLVLQRPLRELVDGKVVDARDARGVRPHAPGDLALTNGWRGYRRGYHTSWMKLNSS